MRKLISLLSLCLVIAACQPDSQSIQSNAANLPQKWVFIHLNVTEESGLDSYYYYAEVSEKLYEQIASNDLNSGFILLRNIHYWGNDDLIYTFKDAENTGDRIFRIEDISMITSVATPPKVGLGMDQYDGPSPAATEAESD